MRIKKKLATTGVAALIGLTGTAVVLPAAPASAEVLINYPGTAVKVGHTFTVGDWFQQWSGGSRWFSTTVYGPTRPPRLPRDRPPPTPPLANVADRAPPPRRLPGPLQTPPLRRPPHL